jgi:hypothetical protein
VVKGLTSGLTDCGAVERIDAPIARGASPRSNTGQILVKYWSNTGQILVKYCSPGSEALSSRALKVWGARVRGGGGGRPLSIRRPAE